jgi:hypothetical protein
MAAKSLLTSVEPTSWYAASGVVPLDMWQSPEYRAVLFQVPAALRLRGRLLSYFCVVGFRVADREWAPLGLVGQSAVNFEHCPGLGVGLHPMGSFSQGRLRLHILFASKEVDTIELRTDGHALHHRSPGSCGICLVGITQNDPISYAIGVTRLGNRLAGSILL